MGWALHWTRKLFGRFPQYLQADEEIGDQLDPIFVDALELEVALDRPLVTCSLGPERDHGDLVCLGWDHRTLSVASEQESSSSGREKMRRVVRTLLGTGMAVDGRLLAMRRRRPRSARRLVARKASNIEAIVDDSISMEFTDANRLRVQAMDLLIDSLGSSTQLGAVEFGSAGFEDNPPLPTPSSRRHRRCRTRARCGPRSTEKVHADNGATDYNAAFAQADADNPTADARIFLTDGGHDVGTYNEAHLVHNVPHLRDRLRRHRRR